MELTINFFEGSYSYNQGLIQLKPHEGFEYIAAGILNELNHQYNYRKTKEDLWASFKFINEEFRVIREGWNFITLKMVVDSHIITVGDYNFQFPENNSLTFIKK